MDTGGKFSYFPVAVVDLDTFGLYNVKRKSEFDGGKKVNDYNEEFWNALDELVETSEIVIDRPKGSIHPRFPDFIYRVDYGYLRDTSSMDGAGIENCTTSLIRVAAA